MDWFAVVLLRFRPEEAKVVSSFLPPVSLVAFVVAFAVSISEEEGGAGREVCAPLFWSL